MNSKPYFLTHITPPANIYFKQRECLPVKLQHSSLFHSFFSHSLIHAEQFNVAVCKDVTLRKFGCWLYFKKQALISATLSESFPHHRVID